LQERLFALNILIRQRDRKRENYNKDAENDNNLISNTKELTNLPGFPGRFLFLFKAGGWLDAAVDGF